MSRPKRVGLALVILVAGMGWWIQLPKAKVGNQLTQKVEESSSAFRSVGETREKLISKSVFFEEYSVENKTIQNDLESVYLLLNDCQLMFKNFDSFFLPDNRAITSFLSGGNPDRLIWIPPSHLAVSQAGELLDRHGTALFFHRVSGLRFEIYSAGEDREMWTEDDVVYPKSGGSGESD